MSCQFEVRLGRGRFSGRAYVDAPVWTRQKSYEEVPRLSARCLNTTDVCNLMTDSTEPECILGILCSYLIRLRLQRGFVSTALKQQRLALNLSAN